MRNLFWFFLVLLTIGELMTSCAGKPVINEFMDPKPTSTIYKLPEPNDMSVDEYKKAVIEAAKGSEKTALEGSWEYKIGVSTRLYTFVGNFLILDLEQYDPGKTHAMASSTTFWTFEISNNNITMKRRIGLDLNGKLNYLESRLQEEGKYKWSLKGSDTLVLQQGLFKDTYKRKVMPSDNAD